MILPIAAIAFAAGAFRGFSGFGMALVAMPFLLLLIPPADAVVMVLIVQTIIGIIDLNECIAWADRRSVAMLSLAACIGTPVGIAAVSYAPQWLAQIVIGLITAGAAIGLFLKASFGDNPGPVKTALVGAASGLLAGLAAAPGPPVIAYYLASPIGTRAKRASMILFFLVSSLIAIASAGLQGTLNSQAILLGVVSSPVCYLGYRIGVRLFHRGSDELYRLIALLFLQLTAMVSIILGTARLLSSL